jgi:hypothetical protein
MRLIYHDLLTLECLRSSSLDGCVEVDAISGVTMGKYQDIITVDFFTLSVTQVLRTFHSTALILESVMESGKMVMEIHT